MIIVLVGSPLAGKTTLLKQLQQNGVKVFSADSHIRKIYQNGEVGYETIKSVLGENFVNEKEVDRRALAGWASEEDNLKKLNELIHPLIAEHLEGKDDFVAELPIITSSSTKFNYDKLILVKASEEEIRNRFSQTNISNPKFINKIIEDWSNDIEYDYVVDTTNDIQQDDISNIINILNEKQ